MEKPSFITKQEKLTPAKKDVFLLNPIEAIDKIYVDERWVERIARRNC